LTVLVPARNEASTVGRVFEGLDSIDYPADELTTVLIDDGSADGTAEQFRQRATERARTLVVELSPSVGKPQALNEALAASPKSELIAVCDADLRPAPDSFRRLAEAFGDNEVALAVGYRRPENADVTVCSRYAAVESWVHQLVTGAGKDRLDVNPPSLGFCVYRRSALEEISGFRARGAEDVDSSLAITRAGWRTRFVPTAVAENLVADRPAHYWSQHMRWSDHLFDARKPESRTTARSRPVPARRRVEAALVGTGYVDRVLLGGAVVTAAVGAIPFWVPGGYLGLRGAEVGVGLLKGGVGRRWPAFVAATVVFFPLDVAASFAAVALRPWRRNHRGWRPQRGQPL